MARILQLNGIREWRAAKTERPKPFICPRLFILIHGFLWFYIYYLAEFIFVIYVHENADLSLNWKRIQVSIWCHRSPNPHRRQRLRNFNTNDFTLHICNTWIWFMRNCDSQYCRTLWLRSVLNEAIDTEQNNFSNTPNETRFSPTQTHRSSWTLNMCDNVTRASLKKREREFVYVVSDWWAVAGLFARTLSSVFNEIPNREQAIAIFPSEKIAIFFIKYLFRSNWSSLNSGYEKATKWLLIYY